MAMTGRLPILTFHAVDDADRSAITFPPTRFTEVIETLQRLGAGALDLGEAASRIRNRASFPARTIALTFDDGYRSVYDVAFPILQRCHLTATVFLAVGQGRTGPDDALPSMNGRHMLRWREIRAMHKMGVTFGAHTLTHPDLTRLPGPRVREEICGSKARLEEALGAPVTSFAYPYGAIDPQARQIVGECFGCACSDRLGVVSARSDPLALERVDAYYLRALPLVGRLFTEWFPWYLRARNLPRRIRRRVSQPAARSISLSQADDRGRPVEEARS